MSKHDGYDELPEEYWVAWTFVGYAQIEWWMRCGQPVRLVQ